jgi:TPR repeat protein
LEGLSRLHGHGIEPNIDEAIYWLNKAANLGEPVALDCLGDMQAKGIGSRVSLSKA